MPRSRSARNSADGLATSRRPAPVISNTPISSVGPKRFFTARRMRNWWRAVALEREHGVDHVLDHARAGDLAVLGDVADQDDRGAASAWRSGSAPAPSRAPGSPCRAPTSTVSVHMVWIESMTTSARRLALRQRRDDVLDRWSRRRARPARRRGRAARRAAAPARPPPRRRCRRRGAPALRERGGGLDQQRRLADAGIAADQQRRAAHEAAAGDAVELGDAGGQARRLVASRRSSGSSAKTRPLRARARRGPPPGRRAAPSSTMVFHSPQASQLPCQRP